ncbi:hypothetical protein B0H21DRAFT_775564 [Amylocystis lapponica]|nr:hypothetical protein B0H21DRAFT_775564 [Amylocystis lapponica]
MTDNRPESEEQHGSQSPSDSVQPQMTMHPITYSGMPMHMYPFPPGVVQAQPPRTKRRQVKNACTNCQKACKKCDDARPCLRCVKYGIAEECIDSQRKERQKGIKRGPYKKRDGKTNTDQQLDVAVPPPMPMPPAIAATSATPPIPYVTPMGFPPGFYGQYPGGPGPKPGEGAVYYPQFYIPVPAHPPPHASGQEGEVQGYPQPQFYPTFLAPYTQPYPPPYMMPHPRPDGQIAMAPAPPPHHYAPYPQAYPKPPSRGPEMSAQALDRRDSRVENGRMDAHGGHGKSA